MPKELRFTLTPVCVEDESELSDDTLARDAMRRILVPVYTITRVGMFCNSCVDADGDLIREPSLRKF